MSATFEQVRALVAEGQVRLSDHGFQELDEDGILPDEVFDSVDAGVVVEDYPDAWKGPTVLFRQTLPQGRQLHALWGMPKSGERMAVLVTAYFPDPELWSADLLSRKRA